MKFLVLQKKKDEIPPHLPGDRFWLEFCQSAVRLLSFEVKLRTVRLITLQKKIALNSYISKQDSGSQLLFRILPIRK